MKENDALNKKILDLIELAEKEKIKMSKEYDMRIAEAIEKEKREAARREEVLRAQNAKIEREKRE